MIKTARGGYFWKWIFSKMPALSSAILEIPAEILSNLKAQKSTMNSCTNARYKKLMMAEFSRSALRDCAYIKNPGYTEVPWVFAAYPVHAVHKISLE